MVRDALAFPATFKAQHFVHRSLIERLAPELADIPLADKFWHGTSSVQKQNLIQVYPDAFSAKRNKPRERSKVRALTGESEATIKRYVIAEGRLSLLDELVRPDAVLRCVNGTPADYRKYDRILMGLFTACVLLSEDWRKDRLK